MNFSDVVDRVAARTGRARVQVDRTLRLAFELMGQELAAGGEVRIVGFGTFAITETRPKRARNFATGEAITIPARRVIKFTAFGRIGKRRRTRYSWDRDHAAARSAV